MAGVVVLVDQTITYLEMTSPDQLRAGAAPPCEITLERVDVTALALIRSIHNRIGTPHHWSTMEWSDQRWRDMLASPAIRSWVARASGDVAGLIQLQAHSEHEVEINTFGLVPEFVGRGFGGHLLTLATRLAWELDEVERVWLHTSSWDHPHALSNYRARGFRPFRVEHRPREMPGRGQWHVQAGGATSYAGRCDRWVGRRSL